MAKKSLTFEDNLDLAILDSRLAASELFNSYHHYLTDTDFDMIDMVTNDAKEWLKVAQLLSVARECFYEGEEQAGNSTLYKAAKTFRSMDTAPREACNQDTWDFLMSQLKASDHPY